MNKYIFNFVLFAALSLNQNSWAQPISGYFTVGQTGDYTNLQTALDDLESNGINGPTTLQLIDSQYEGLNAFPSIPGNSTINTITIRGNQGTQVKPPAGAPLGQRMWEIKGSNYRFSNLDFELSLYSYFYTLEITTVNNLVLEIDSCDFNGSYAALGDLNAALGTSSFSSGTISNIQIKNSTFTNIGAPVQFLENGIPQENIRVKNCTFSQNQFPISIGYFNNALVEDNRIFGYSQQAISIFNSSSNNAKANIQNNTVNNINLGTQGQSIGISCNGLGRLTCNNNIMYNYATGITTENIDTLNIEQNEIEKSSRAVSIESSDILYITDNIVEYVNRGFSFSNCDAELLFADNIIRIDRSEDYETATGLRLNNVSNPSFSRNYFQNNIIEGAQYGVYLRNTSELSFMLNTVICLPVADNNSAMYAENGSESSIKFNLFYIDSLNDLGIPAGNNIMYNLNAMGSNVIMDENGFYFAPNTGNEFSSGDFSAQNLAGFVGASSMETNSLFADPKFYDANFLYEPTNGAYMDLITNNSGVNIDIYGRMREHGYPGAVEGNYWDAGITAIPNHSFNLYPNPANDFIQITTSFIGKIYLEFVDIEGRIIHSEHLYSHGLTFSYALPSNINTGLYFLCISNNQEAETKRIQVNRQ